MAVASTTPLWILATIALAFFLRETRDICVPVALALLLSFPLAWLTGRLDRLGMPRILGAGLVVGAVVASLGWVGWTLRDDAARSMEQLPTQLRQIQAELRAQTDGGMLARLREAAHEVQQMAATDPSAPDQPAPAAPPAATASDGLQGLINVAGQITLIVFLVFFLLVGATAWHDRLVSLAGDMLSSRREGAQVIDDIHAQIVRFLLVRAVTSLAVAVATWLALLAVGAPSPLLWGAAAGIFNVIPYFGPLIVSVGLAVVGFVSDGLSMATQLAAIALVITTLEGWLITPPLLGRAAELNTLAVLLGLLFWSWVWGVWGAILAVPMMAIVKSVADHVEPLGALSLLLGKHARR